MYSGDDAFKVSLLDGSRFDRFTFFHKNYKANLGHFHKQFDCHDLEYGLYKCFTHDFNVKYSIQSKTEDWKRFKRDALKYKLLDI